MDSLQPYVVPNLIYLTLMAGLWLAVLALASPGTGLLEILAVTALMIAGAGTLTVPFDPWALLAIGAGGIVFVGSLRWRRTTLWLIVSALLLSLGSAYLFGQSAGVPEVHPLLAATVSLLTVGFFGLAVRRAIVAQRARLLHDPADLIGKTGEVRTPLDPVGSVYVGSELWSARSDVPIPVGGRVRVRDRDGLILLVEPAPPVERAAS